MAKKTVTISIDELDALVQSRVAAALNKRADEDSGETPLPLNRRDLSGHHPLVRALVAIASHVGMNVDPTDGYTPFEAALAELIVTIDTSAATEETATEE